MTTRVFWLFGRGASVSCNLTWVVPDSWRILERSEQIERIKASILTEMNKKEVLDSPTYKLFLHALANHTIIPWQHLFITTNWDYLLQRDVLNLNVKILPKWLANSHVSHLNGTVEVLDDNSNRSPFLLEDDPPNTRVWTVEANITFNEMIWGQFFVVVGMSFECRIDKFLLTMLNKVEDDLPIGESTWLLINPDEMSLEQSALRIQSALPSAIIHKIPYKFDDWINSRMPQLQDAGVLSF